MMRRTECGERRPHDLKHFTSFVKFGGREHDK